MPKLEITPDPLTEGTTATIKYTGGPPGVEITVDIDDGGNPPQQEQVPLFLDSDGNGTAEWTVPSGWQVANFNAPNVPEKSIPIEGSAAATG